MAHFRGDGGKLLDQAVRETDLRRKVELLVDGMILHINELEQVLSHLGAKNFDTGGLKELAREVRECLG